MSAGRSSTSSLNYWAMDAHEMVFNVVKYLTSNRHEICTEIHRSRFILISLVDPIFSL